jgi:hypothetical protein
MHIKFTTAKIINKIKIQSTETQLNQLVTYVHFVSSVRMVTTVHSSNMATITVPREHPSTNQMKMVAFCPPSAMVLTILSATSLVEMCKDP